MIRFDEVEPGTWEALKVAVERPEATDELVILVRELSFEQLGFMGEMLRLIGEDATGSLELNAWTDIAETA